MSFVLEDQEHGTFVVNIPAMGRHNVANALAAYCAATRLGCDAKRVIRGLSNFEQTGRRQKVVDSEGVTVIEDCYNANPDSMKAALAMFKDFPCKRRFALLGDMLELGNRSAAEHYRIGRIAATKADVECFVHGAICVGYSGRCFLSRSMSERSGNRGACSQPCRLTYDLTDGRGRSYLSGRHLLSVRDLDLSGHIGELLDAGVTSFKIEGRLKDINYIRNVVAYYRRAVDEALAARPQLRRSSVGVSRPDFRPDPAKSFTRGASEYFFAGRSAGVASFDTPKSVGEYVGRVVSCDARSFRLDGDVELAPGDGICFVTGRGPSGTNVNAVEGRRITPNRMEGIRPGVELYRNFDRRFNLVLERSRTRRVIPVTARVEFMDGGLRLSYRDCEGFEASAGHDGPFDEARDVAAMERTLRTQAARCGDTIFEVRDVSIEGPVRFVPASLLGELRREALDGLRRLRIEAPRTHRILPDDGTARYPSDTLTAEENVTNHLAEEFYRAHGVRRIERGLDLAPSTAGHTVMRSAYCIRREIGECLKEHPRLRGDLYLERGSHRYRLCFDCARCEMSLGDCSAERQRDEKTDKPKPNR